MHRNIRFACAVLLVLCSATVGRAIPPLMNCQGLLSDNGTPITTPTSVEFRLYDMRTGGTALWMETQSVTPDNQGRFTALLGSGTPLPPAAIAMDSTFLGITISPNPEIVPRLQLAAGAYAFRVGTIDGAAGGTVTGDVLISGKATIGAGNANTGIRAFVAGENNSADGDFSVLGGGMDNTVVDSFTTVGGGRTNVANGLYSTIGGGQSNTTHGYWNTIAGGQSNSTYEANSAIGGGLGNQASGVRSTISGGHYNTIASGADYAAISGGRSDLVTGSYSWLGGGRFNRIRGEYSVVCGGGGAVEADSNAASGDYASIGGGRRNIASGNYASVAGGYNNLAAGSYSFAGGYNATALENGKFVWSDASSANPFNTFYGQNSFDVRAYGGVFFATGEVGFGSPVGARLDPGATAWATVSDSTLKTNIRPVDGGEILDRLEKLPVTRWNYKHQVDDPIDHIGPMAQDFYRLFGVGHDDKTISTIDPDGIALAAIKELNARNVRLEAENQELAHALTEQQKEIDALRVIVEGLSQK